MLEQTFLVDGDYWSTPASVVEFRARVKDGSNLCRIMASEPATTLADGREVAFLLIGDVEALGPSGSRPN